MPTISGGRATGYGLPAVFVKLSALGTKVFPLISHNFHANKPKESWPFSSLHLVF